VRALALPPGDWRLVIGGAVLTCAAYPPFHLFLPSFLCLIPAAWLILDGADDPRPVRRHLAQGFWFGLAANGLLLHWMVVALWHFTPLSILGYAGTVIGLALYSAVLFAVTGWVMRTTRLSLLLVFPVLWTALEWIVGHQGDFRFPWLGLGTSLTGYPTVVQLADIVGARGVTWLLVLANVALALAWRHRAARRQAAVLAGGVGLGLVVALAYGVVRERTIDLRVVGKVTVVQPNIGYEEKWEQAQQDSIVNGLLNLTAEALMAGEPLLEGAEPRDPDLVVWPEAAVPGYFQQNPVWLVNVKDFSATTRTSMLLGALDFAQTEEGRVGTPCTTSGIWCRSRSACPSPAHAGFARASSGVSRRARPSRCTSSGSGARTGCCVSGRSSATSRRSRTSRGATGGAVRSSSSTSRTTPGSAAPLGPTSTRRTW
jgi:apolipoprotein N-acyltransferase